MTYFWISYNPQHIIQSTPFFSQHLISIKIHFSHSGFHQPCKPRLTDLYSQFTNQKYEITLFCLLFKLLFLIVNILFCVQQSFLIRHHYSGHMLFEIVWKLSRKNSYQSAVPSAFPLTADPETCRDEFRGYLLGSYSIGFAPHQRVLVFY